MKSIVKKTAVIIILVFFCAVDLPLLPVQPVPEAQAHALFTGELTDRISLIFTRYRVHCHGCSAAETDSNAARLSYMPS